MRLTEQEKRVALQYRLSVAEETIISLQAKLEKAKAMMLRWAKFGEGQVSMDGIEMSSEMYATIKELEA